MNARTVFIALCLTWSWVTTSFASVSIERTEYKGWVDAVHLNNGEVELVVVPQIGRIMHYGFIGDENILWLDPETHGTVLPDGKPVLDELLLLRG